MNIVLDACAVIAFFRYEEGAESVISYQLSVPRGIRRLEIRNHLFRRCINAG